MGFDLVAKNQANRAMVLQNLLEEEEDKIKIFSNTLITREQLEIGLPSGYCFKVHFNDEHQDMMDWVCRDDLDHFWNHKCMFGACDDVEELHKLFLGQCVNVHDSVLCPQKAVNIHELSHMDIGPEYRIFGDVILSVNDIMHAFRGGRCFKAGHTFVCENDIPAIMRTGCVDVHQHDETGHNILKICNADFVRLIYGDVLNV